jgi:vacuolar-type H+-ATPase subunit I/STV1
MRPMPIVLFSAVALVAQAPASADLAQRFNTELPGINQMLKTFQAKEALVKVETLVPAERPAFNGANLQTIGLSLDNAQGLMSLYRLWANVAAESGQWEKAVEIQQKRVKAAQAIRADLDKAQAPIAAQWEKAAKDSQDYLSKNASRQQELQASLNALQEDVAAVNAKTKKLDAKGMEELKARIAKAPQEQQELDQIAAALPVHKQNLGNAPKITKVLADNRKEADGLLKAAEEAAAKSKEVLASQNDEITKFNTEQVIKKVKIVGKKNWVDAVLRNPENVTKLNGSQAQAAFLNRLLVLDPGNAGAQKALDNLKQGKEPFVKEAKGAKKGSAKKK